MANGDAPPRANDSVTPVKESHPQVQVSIEDVKEFLSTVKEGVSGAVDTATRLFGAPEFFGAAGITTGAEGEVNPGLTPHGGKQGKPVIDFNPSAGGGCFGDIPAEEGVGPSHTGGKIPLDLNKPVKKNGGDETSALSALANQLSFVAGVVGKDLADFFQRPATGEAKKPDIIRAPHETDTTKLNTLENQKRERLDKSIKEVTENLPESLGKTKDLVENVHGLLTGQDVDANTLSTLRDLSQAAAAELGENGSKSSREALVKLSEELRQDYGIDLKIDENGLSMSDGTHSLSVDSKGNVIASSMPSGGEDASSHPENAEAMLKALRHSFNMNSHNQNQLIKSIPTHIPEVKGAPMEKPNPNTKGGRIIVNADPSKAGPAQTGRQTPDTTSNHDEITRMLEMYRKMQAKE